MPTESLSANSPTVAVLGMGNMGSAIARALLAAGRTVVVWNRTPERADAVIAEGATAMTTVSAAVRAAPVTIVCLSSSDDVRAVLDEVADQDVAGRAVINVTSGTPADAQALSDRASTAGIGYLDGVIGAYPEQMGTAEALIMVSGAPELWETYRDVVVAVAGRSTHVGDEVAAANVIDAGLTGAFYMSSLVSFIEAVRYMNAVGVSNDAVAELVAYATGVLQHQMLAALNHIDEGNLETDQATITVFANASAAFAEAMGTVGEATMIEAAADICRRGVEAGMGDQDLSALHKL
ncbi:NAD(P)-dependent oxidoreductase [Gordonia sp. OPL2]|uniref:NAD(P)-dependent oxidoreductase n=1 Tax=Gordonia sp. OPL2 TaxID=2486274 RepID=UPI0016559F13|nr:NAD(P)-binding domain-containing protein [Gordonia sp. OPL2]ROZ99353.1 NAD(P)-dependent oxidoreductase [Gordonia sp. OPL2]